MERKGIFTINLFNCVNYCTAFLHQVLFCARALANSKHVRSKAGTCSMEFERAYSVLYSHEVQCYSTLKMLWDIIVVVLFAISVSPYSTMPMVP